MDTLLNELNAPITQPAWMILACTAVFWAVACYAIYRAARAAGSKRTISAISLESMMTTIAQRQERLEQELTKRNEITTRIVTGCAEHCLRLDNIEAYLAGQSDGPAAPKLHKPPRDSLAELAARHAAPPSASMDNRDIKTDKPARPWAFLHTAKPLGSNEQFPNDGYRRELTSQEAADRKGREQFPDGTRLEVK